MTAPAAYLCDGYGPADVPGVPQPRALIIAAGADDMLVVRAALDAADPRRMRLPACS